MDSLESYNLVNLARSLGHVVYILNKIYHIDMVHMLNKIYHIDNLQILSVVYPPLKYPLHWVRVYM